MLETGIKETLEKLLCENSEAHISGKPYSSFLTDSKFPDVLTDADIKYILGIKDEINNKNDGLKKLKILHMLYRAKADLVQEDLKAYVSLLDAYGCYELSINVCKEKLKSQRLAEEEVFTYNKQLAKSLKNQGKFEQAHAIYRSQIRAIVNRDPKAFVKYLTLCAKLNDEYVARLSWHQGLLEIAWGRIKNNKEIEKHWLSLIEDSYAKAIFWDKYIESMSIYKKILSEEEIVSPHTRTGFRFLELRIRKLSIRLKSYNSSRILRIMLILLDNYQYAVAKLKVSDNPHAVAVRSLILSELQLDVVDHIRKMGIEDVQAPSISQLRSIVNHAYRISERLENWKIVARATLVKVRLELFVYGENRDSNAPLDYAMQLLEELENKYAKRISGNYRLDALLLYGDVAVKLGRVSLAISKYQLAHSICQNALRKLEEESKQLLLRSKDIAVGVVPEIEYLTKDEIMILISHLKGDYSRISHELVGIGRRIQQWLYEAVADEVSRSMYLQGGYYRHHIEGLFRREKEKAKSKNMKNFCNRGLAEIAKWSEEDKETRRRQIEEWNLKQLLEQIIASIDDASEYHDCYRYDEYLNNILVHCNYVIFRKIIVNLVNNQLDYRIKPITANRFIFSAHVDQERGLLNLVLGDNIGHYQELEEVIQRINVGQSYRSGKSERRGEGLAMVNEIIHDAFRVVGDWELKREGSFKYLSIPAFKLQRAGLPSSRSSEFREVAQRGAVFEQPPSKALLRDSFALLR